MVFSHYDAANVLVEASRPKACLQQYNNDDGDDDGRCR
jgi:hypothetical protein